LQQFLPFDTSFRSPIIYQYRQAGLKMPMVTITQDGDYTPEALKELGDIALGIKGESSYPWQIDTPINKKFVQAIKAKTKVVPSCSEQNAIPSPTWSWMVSKQRTVMIHSANSGRLY
jgi:ABC-type branched-subunit amino acid transport system substrate-binding protein